MVSSRLHPPATVLVVDDVAANRLTLCELLEPEDYRLVEASDGPSALRLAAEEPPDVVLLDVMMPGMDGFEVCRRLRADGRLAEVPVIMVTALDDHASRLAGLDAGADDFITKPFNRAELRARVGTIARLNRYRRLHEAQVALRESEKHFRALFDSAGVAVYTCDAAGKIQDFNRHAVEMWGREPKPGESEELFSGSFKMCRADGSILPREQSAIAGVCAGRIPDVKDQEFLVERHDGSRITLLVNIVSLKNERGEITCVINSFYDITARKRADEERRESDERYRVLFNSMDEGFCVIEVLFDQMDQPVDYRFLETNPKFEQQSGLSAAVGKTVRELVPTIEAVWIQRFGEVARTGKSTRFTNRVEGLNRWFDIHAFRFGESANGKVAVLFSDISARALAEQTLRASEARFRALFDSGPVAIFSCDSAGTMHDFNRHALELLGRKPEPGETLQQFRRSFKFYQPDGTRMADEQSAMLKVLNGSIPSVTEEELVIERPDGLRITVVANVVPLEDEHGKITGAINCFHDITVRKATEAVQRENEQWLRAVFEQSAVGVVQTDASTGHFLRVNQRFCDIIGYTREEMERLSFNDVTHTQDLAHNLENVMRLREGSGREFAQEKRYVRKDGSTVWTSIAVSSIGPPGGVPVSFIAFVQDITERRRLDEHFLQAQKMEALGQFSGGVAHDFNNILAAIGGYTELSRMLLTGNPDVHEHLGAVLQAAGRAADLVKQILTFSRQQPQVRKSIRLQPVITESLKLLRATIPTTIEIETAIEADAPTVLANANQVHQVLMNLAINAGHAMKDRPGRLRVTLESFVVSAEYAATKPRLGTGSYVRVSVSDTGCGMAPETLRRIFEPFFTTKAPGEGTGLGLSVLHGIMDSHDGAVTVHSQPGEGTTFNLYFPAHNGEAAAGLIDEGPTPRGNGERVLVVDDEELLAVMVHKTLTQLGYQAESATEPAAALALVRADPGRFKLALSDQTMPGMTGLALARELREISPGLPVILMTGYSLSLTAERIEEAGVRQVMLKPVTIHSLGTAVHAAISGAPPPYNGSNSPYR